MISLSRPHRRETLNWRRRVKHKSTQAPPLSAVDGDNDGDSHAIPPLSTVPLQFHLSHRRASKHSSSSLFDLSSIDEEHVIVMFQKLKKQHDSSIDEEIIVNLFSISFQLTRNHMTSEHLSSSMLAKIYCETC